MVDHPSMLAAAPTDSRSPTAAAPGRMGRKRARTEAQLLAATRKVVADKGITGTTIALVTEEADVAFGTFYNYFPSKEAAVETVTRQVVDELRGDIDALVQGISDPTTRVAVGTAMILRRAVQDPQWRAFVSEIARADNSEYQALGLRLVEDLDAGQRDGSFELDDLAAVLAVFGGSIRAAIEGLRGGYLDPSSTSSVVSHLLRSLGVPGSRCRELAGLAWEMVAAEEPPPGDRPAPRPTTPPVLDA